MQRICRNRGRFFYFEVKYEPECLFFSDISLYKKDKGFYQNRIKKQRVKGIFTNGNNRNEKNESRRCRLRSDQ